MWLLAKRTGVVLGTGLALAAVLAFIYASRWVLIAFLFAIFLADLLAPLVSRIQQWRKVSRGSRTIAILEVYAIGGLIILLLAVFVGPRIGEEIRRLGAALPELLEKVNSGQIVRQFGAKHGWSYETQVRLESFLAHHSGAAISLESQFGEYAGAFARSVIWFLLIPIPAFFFLKDGRDFAEEVIRMVERTRPQRLVRRLFEDLNQMVAHYVRAQLALAGLAMAVYTLVFWLMGLPYSFALSSIAGILEFIPVVGPAVAAVVIVSISFLGNYPHLLIVVLFLGIWRILQDYVISPRVMGTNLEMHPLAAIFAVLVGAEVWGVVGVYLSIPIMASLRILWRSWHRYAEMQAQTQAKTQLETRRPAA